MSLLKKILQGTEIDAVKSGHTPAGSLAKTKELNLQDLKEVIQSSHLNFLIGAGLSNPFFPVLGDVETRLNAANTIAERVEVKKEYFKKIVLPNLSIVQDREALAGDSNFQVTFARYKEFFSLIRNILAKRKSTLLSRQANIFTTNIDVLMETALEDSQLQYNDGFSGRINPRYNLSNYKISHLKRSLHFENVSEIPAFNIIKIHGSLTWNKVDDHICYSKLGHFDEALLEKEGKSFEDGYRKLAIVNPQKKKLEETVIDLTYYELLRMYASELEKENSVLFVLGFSMEDEHIREITIRTANSNPTLKIYVFCHSKGSELKMKKKLGTEHLRYSNITLIEPKDEGLKYNLEGINNAFFKEISSGLEYGD